MRNKEQNIITKYQDRVWLLYFIICLSQLRGKLFNQRSSWKTISKGLEGCLRTLFVAKLNFKYLLKIKPILNGSYVERNTIQK